MPLPTNPPSIAECGVLSADWQRWGEGAVLAIEGAVQGFKARNFWGILALAAVIQTCLSISVAAQDNFLPLQNGWRIQSSAETSGSGATISASGFDVSNWHATIVPTTVLGALADDGTYKNIYFGTNFAAIPKEPFANSWWFREEFDLNGGQSAGNADLIFEGINYRANVWLNGKQIASTNELFGAYRIFKLDVSGKLEPGKNVLAVEVFPPRPGDFTLGFVDWDPKPADSSMGLFRPVKLHFYKTVALDNLFVESKIDHSNWQNARLTIVADLKNHSDRTVQTTIKGKIGDVSFKENFTLQAGEKRTVSLTPDKHPELNFKSAKLWWPWELGDPNLYNLELTAQAEGKTSDAQQVRFGIREVADYMTPEGYRGYMVNGKKILIRAGAWGDELLLREDKYHLDSQFQYVRTMNLNAIRLEGFWGGSQRLYDLADENGVLVLVGWSCQWEWKDYLGKECDKFGGVKSQDDMELLTNYLHDQVTWLRNHPGIFTWVLGSDKLPRPELEKRYDSMLAGIDPTRPKLKTCGDDKSKISGPSGVKMNGPYDYVPPDYWYLDTKNGGAYGFNTETSPGPEPPPLETLKRMIPAGHLWPIDDFWNAHCSRNEFSHMDRYMTAYTNRYGAPASVEEFAYKSQAANYEALRPMYESFAVNLPHTTGIVQWMMNSQWPKFFWQLYDYYLTPGGAFFAAKKGASPFAIIYDYGDNGIYLVNQTGKAPGICSTTVAVYDLNSKIILNQTITNNPLAYGSQKIDDLSSVTPQTPVYFLDLKTTSDSGMEADNFYWLSTKPDVLDEENSTWFVTPIKSFADFTALNQMPQANVKAGVSFGISNDGTHADVTLTNSSDTLAFFIEMKIVGANSHQYITPVFWDDNYVTIPPHASKVFHAHFPSGQTPELKLQGWNVKFDTK